MSALGTERAREDEGLEPRSNERRVRIVSEPLTYAVGAPASYFRDLALSEINEDTAATARLRRHADEMEKELPDFEARARTVDGMEYRVNPNRTAGQGGNFAPPLWLIEQAATAPRPGRVLASMIPSFALPPGVSSVNLPRLTTGTDTGVAADGGAVPSQDIIDALVTSPAMPIAGQGDIALQNLEQSPAGAHLDHAIFADLSADYDTQLETLLFNGSGVNGQFYGLLNLPTGAGLVSAIAFTDANPTPPEMVLPLSQAAAQLGDARGLPPETWLMRTARWAWLNAFDTTTRPLPLAPLLGFPHRLDDAIPTNVGGAARDAIIACRPSDMILLESAPRTSVKLEVLSGTLQARLQLHGYAAALLGRYPTGIATVTGTGMAIASGY